MTKRERIAAYREAARMVARKRITPRLWFAMFGRGVGLYEDLLDGALAGCPMSFVLDREESLFALLLAAEMVRTGDL